MLTQQQIEQYRKKYNIIPPATPQSGGIKTQKKTLEQRLSEIDAVGENPNISASLPIENQPKEQSYFERVGGALKNVITEPSKYFMESVNKNTNPVSTALGTVRRGLEGIGSAAYSVLPEKITQPIDSLVGEAAKKIKLPEAINLYKGFKQENPNLAKIIQPVEDSARIALAMPAFKGLQVGVEDGVKTVEKISEKQAVKAAEKATKESSRLTTSIINGKIKDIPVAQKVLTSIDTKAIKTYSDLKNVLKNKTDDLLKEVNSLLVKDKNLYKPEKLSLTKKVGLKEVNKDFVSEAIDHLESVYKTSNDIVNTERMSQLRNRLKKTGISLEDVNNIAKEYGVEIGQKAFSKTGEPLTSVSARAAENTRKGIKETLRELSPDKKSLDSLDKQASESIRIEKLVSSVDEGVNRLAGKIKQEGPIMQTGRTVGKFAGKAVDIATGGIARNFLTSFLPSNIGNKVMNFVDLEKNLNKSLKRLKEIENKKIKLPKKI